MESSSDARTANVMRSDYRVLSEEEKLQVKELKDRGEEFVRLCKSIGRSRELSLAITKMEEAVMWSVKWVTGDKGD
jgi:hypothetical protein